MTERLTIEEMRNIAKKHIGECLSMRYINSQTKLNWRCKEGHTWGARPHDIKQGKWCPYCVHNVRLSLKEMQKLAEERGGKCLSKKYINTQTNLLWRCSERHEWKAIPNNIKKGQWCPICSKGVSERICREFFERIFNKKFPLRKPDWLLISNGRRLELDGYCEELNLAFEYNGWQHQKSNNFFSKKMSFERRQQLDKLKRKLCKKHGIILIEVPHTVTYDKMQNYILKKCRKRGVKIPKVSKIDYNSFDIYSPKKLEEMQRIAKERGGKCLSKRYITSQTNLKWQCKDGHEWLAIPNNIKRGSWCPYCAGKAKQTIDKMRAVAKSKGGKCLSMIYVNNETKLRWACKEGHEWLAIPCDIKNGGRWCPYCAHKAKLTIQEMQAIASSRGGECLSKRYVNTGTKLKWRCDHGHTWEATPSSVKNCGSWCPVYACKQARKTRIKTL